MRAPLTMLFALVLLLLPARYAFAADIDNAFDSLLNGVGDSSMSVSSAGAFSAGGRTIVTGGALDIKFPKSKPINMFSLTPPSISMGCSGISAFFGGFSFINTAQIQELISNIVRGAIGFVAQLAIKTLCPMCEAVLQKMQDLATAGARLNINSCQVGKNLAQAVLNNGKPFTTTGQGENAANKCGQAMMDSGNATAGDTTDDLYQFCRDTGRAMDSIKKFISEKVSLLNGLGSDPAAPGKLEKLSDVTEKLCGSYELAGNSTWCALSAMRSPTMKSQNEVGTVDTAEYRNRVLIMNMVGTMAPPSTTIANTTISAEGTTTPAATTESTTNATPMFYAPAISAEAVYAIFMCGSYRATADAPEIVADCDNIFKEVSLPANAATFTEKVLMNCFPKEGVPTTGQELEALFCRDIHMGANGISLNKLLGVGSNGSPTETSFKGFYPMVHELLLDGVKSIREGTPLYGAWDGSKINISADPKKARLYALVSVSPIPLYKVMNLAAIYPGASREFLKVNAVLLAEMMTQAYLNQILTLTNAMGGGAKYANQTVIDRVHEVMDRMRLLTRRKQEQTTAVFAIQQHLMAQIMQMEKGLQQSVFTAELQAPENFSNAALRAAINGARETPNTK